MSAPTKFGRQSYAQSILGNGNIPPSANDEGEAYHFGNACWVNDNVASWNGLGSNQEGSDCSGFVAKAWALTSNFAANAGWHYWPTNDNTRPGGFWTQSAWGQYGVGSGNASFVRVALNNRVWFDHVSSSVHDAIVWTVNYGGTNRDLTIEATGTQGQTTIPGSGYRVRDVSVMQAFARNGWA